MNSPLKFNIIYSDPAWQYRQKSKSLRGIAESHYDVMSIEDIKKLPVSNLAADNCILFLWATFPLLQEALDVIDAWGFEYKTLGFSWIKTNKKSGTPFFGIGHYTRSNCEPCLMGIKGKPDIIDNTVSSVIIAPREEHSKKPAIVRDKIVQLCGDVPRIELFSRQTTPGWHVWGNEVEGSYEDWL